VSRIGQLWRFEWMIYPEQIMLVVRETATSSQVLDLLTGKTQWIDNADLREDDESPKMFWLNKGES
jgi:hypothetical protein